MSIPLGIRKAVYNGSRFDVWSSAFIIIGYAIPAFLFAILLIVFFAGGSYFDLFPLRGLVSANFDSLPASKNHRLSVAYHAAGAGDSDWWLCGADHADQKLIP